jgi:hypothetical protein
MAVSSPGSANCISPATISKPTTVMVEDMQGRRQPGHREPLRGCAFELSIEHREAAAMATPAGSGPARRPAMITVRIGYHLESDWWLWNGLYRPQTVDF